MKKFITIFLTIALFLSLSAALISCKNNDGDGTDEDNAPTTVSVAQNADGLSKRMEGIVYNLDYEAVAGVKVNFGEEPAYAATSDADGAFSFYYYDPQNFGTKKMMDYIDLDAPEYDFLPILYSDDAAPARCVIAVSPVEDEFDMDGIRTNYEIRADFGSRVKVPGDYPLFDWQTHERKEYTAENDGMYNVKIYVNGNYCGATDEGGSIKLPFIMAGAVINAVYENFEFSVRRFDGDSNRPFTVNDEQWLFLPLGEENEYTLEEGDEWITLLSLRGFSEALSFDDEGKPATWDEDALIDCGTWRE